MKELLEKNTEKAINEKVDVVEVVRCKDCKHYDGNSCSEIAYIMDGYYRGTFELKKPTDFCSYGERI